ncbi:MAG: EthD domain-containing protein [Myxococcota bacterium]
MEKLVYLAWCPAPLESWKEALLGPVAQAWLDAGVAALNVSVSDLVGREIEKPSLLMGDGATVSAAISVWLDSIDDRRALEGSLAPHCERLEGYLVTESIPQRCDDRDWPDGARSPGVTHFTWFPKPERLTDGDFYRAWHEVHTPFSFDLHPLRWEYVRNAVARPLTAGAPPIRAIVAERFRSLEDYTDPKRLYGGREVLSKVMEDTEQFADVSDMHSVPLSEYILRS